LRSKKKNWRKMDSFSREGKAARIGILFPFCHGILVPTEIFRTLDLDVDTNQTDIPTTEG
jgi:hypothetical protein